MHTSPACRDFHLTRRDVLRSSLGLLGGLSLADLLALRSSAAAAGAGQARSCIVFFCWGGMSQLETWDPKPDAPREIRGDYRPIQTTVPGLHLGEYMPVLARQAHRLAIVRSVQHQSAGHRNAAYWNLTGHPPFNIVDDSTILPSRKDWPCLGSMVAKFKQAKRGLPGNVALPYPIADRGLCNGQFGGFLGVAHDPLVLRPKAGTPYTGVSPATGSADLDLPAEVSAARLRDRLGLMDQVTRGPRASTFEQQRQRAVDLLLSPKVSAAFDLEKEPAKLRERYGGHICGQSALLARRLAEAGVPLVTIYASVGDLNGSQGDNWDTHGDNLNRLKNRLLPPLEQSVSALLDDLAERGQLDETLVVILTEFGRTPRPTGTGRDHFPLCYSVAFAGGGIQGGQVHGRSNKIASEPADKPCGPNDLHATIFHALGIPTDAHFEDNLGRPLALTDGRPLPLFG
jgi:hypothetical protein